MGLEAFRRTLQQKSPVLDDAWNMRVQQLGQINAYLPAILKWHGTHRNIEPVSKLQYCEVPTKDVKESIQQMKQLGLLNDDYRVKSSYKTELVKIADYAYRVMARRMSSMNPKAVLLYASQDDKFKVVYRPNFDNGISKSLGIDVRTQSNNGRLVRNKSNVSNNVNNSSNVPRMDILLPPWSSVKSMSGVEFERYCMNVLKLNGFTDVRGTVTSGDGGVDILARKAGELYAIQCKRWKGTVGIKVVQEIYTGAALNDATKAVVMTNSRFTQSAITAAKKLNVILWNGNDVERMSRLAK